MMIQDQNLNPTNNEVYDAKFLAENTKPTAKDIDEYMVCKKENDETGS